MSLPSGVYQRSYAQDMAIFRTRTQWVLLLVFLAILFTCPLYCSDRLLTVMTIIGITVISVLGLNILTGYCGQISLGHAGFMAAGGYISAVLTAQLGLSFWAALPCAGLGAGLIGIIFGLPSLKIKGFYLIMATVAAHFIIIWLILQFYDVTGGADGLSVPRPVIGDVIIRSKGSYFWLVMVFTCLAVYFAKNIVRTRVGRAFVAIRDNDLAAEVMGVNLWVYKLTAFFLGCVFAGVSGSLLVHYYAFASTDHFPFLNSVWYLGMLIVGGMGSIAGSIFGVVALKLLDELVTIVGPVLASAVAPQAAASLGLIMRGLVIILFLIFEPRGLAHRWEIIKSYYRRWPFSY
ncbi:MAG: branched-chain amino acid ABC transporter permease [Dehalococcoidales bacterium]|nr:branched-chain amino acid ABC transporter permease [Dehalococcoidales bacterium]